MSLLCDARIACWRHWFLCVSFVAKSTIYSQCNPGTNRVWRMSRLTPDGTAEPISRGQIPRRERGRNCFSSFPLISWSQAGLANHGTQLMPTLLALMTNKRNSTPPVGRKYSLYKTRLYQYIGSGPEFSTFPAQLTTSLSNRIGTRLMRNLLNVMINNTTNSTPSWDKNILSVKPDCTNIDSGPEFLTFPAQFTTSRIYMYTRLMRTLLNVMSNNKSLPPPLWDINIISTKKLNCTEIDSGPVVCSWYSHPKCIRYTAVMRTVFGGFSWRNRRS